MREVKPLFTGIQAMLTVLMMVGCMGDADPVRVSLDIDASDLVMTIGETSTRMGRLPSPYTWMRTAPTGMRRQTVPTG